MQNQYLPAGVPGFLSQSKTVITPDVPIVSTNYNLAVGAYRGGRFTVPKVMRVTSFTIGVGIAASVAGDRHNFGIYKVVQGGDATLVSIPANNYTPSTEVTGLKTNNFPVPAVLIPGEIYYAITHCRASAGVPAGLTGCTFGTLGLIGQMIGPGSTANNGLSSIANGALGDVDLPATLALGAGGTTVTTCPVMALHQD